MWQNYAQRQADFAKKNSKCTKELGDEQQQAIKDAYDLPDIAVRCSIPKEARDTMNKTATLCANNGRNLPALLKVVTCKISGMQ